MDQILLAITTEIKEEATKDDIDLVRLKNLVEFALHVKNMTIDSVTDISSISPTSMVPFGQGRPIAAYGPPPMERLLRELLPQALSLLEKKEGNTISNITALANAYRDLRNKDPKLAAKLRVKLDKILTEDEEKKEENDETIHS